MKLFKKNRPDERAEELEQESTAERLLVDFVDIQQLETFLNRNLVDFFDAKGKLKKFQPEQLIFVLSVLFQQCSIREKKPATSYVEDSQKQDTSGRDVFGYAETIDPTKPKTIIPLDYSWVSYLSHLNGGTSTSAMEGTTEIDPISSEE